MNELFKQNGLEKLEDVTVEKLQALVPGCFSDARQVEIVDKVLKRVRFAMGAGYYTLYGDCKNGDRFVQFYGDARFLKVNKSDRFDELNALDEADRVERRRQRELKAAQQTEGWVRVARQPRQSDGGSYPVDRSHTPVAADQIKVGDLLLLQYGAGTQLFVVDGVTGKKGLVGRRLNSRGTAWAAWCVPGHSKHKQSRISRFDPRILGLGRLAPQDPKP